jgi:hypothetical protein
MRCVVVYEKIQICINAPFCVYKKYFFMRTEEVKLIFVLLFILKVSFSVVYPEHIIIKTKQSPLKLKPQKLP